MKTGNFAGIDIDYRNVSPSLKDRYTAFVSALAQALHADGRTLTLTLPMPANDNGTMQSGAYDWEQLGRLADTIEVAAEVDQELYFQNTEAALAYITDKVDRTKVLLSISSLSIERGGDGLHAMAMNDALARASVISVKTTGDITPGATVQLVAQNLSEGASGLHWDDQARSVTFSYPGRGGKRTVWISNQFSAGFRLELAQRFGLGGVAIDDVSLEGGGADVWAPVQQLSDTGSLTLTRPNGQLFTPAWTANDGVLSAPSGASTSVDGAGAGRLLHRRPRRQRRRDPRRPAGDARRRRSRLLPRSDRSAGLVGGAGDRRFGARPKAPEPAAAEARPAGPASGRRPTWFAALSSTCWTRWAHRYAASSTCTRAAARSASRR